MNMSNKLYIHVATVGHCIILAQYLGEDPNTGRRYLLLGIPSFFAAYMLKDCKPGCCLEEATDIQRISYNRKTYAELVPYCNGFNEAAQMWRGVQPHDWRHRGTINPKNIEAINVLSPEMKRLRMWPKEPEAANALETV